MPQIFTSITYHQLCDQLALMDPDLKMITDHCGYPVMWSRPNTFESLVHIILEQQVSLASALSALNKLKEKVQKITPETILALSDAELKACYFSRQKMVYVRHLAEAVYSGQIDLLRFESLEDDEIRRELVQLKGVGDWTVDIYLMMILHRNDVFPAGDLAAVNAVKRIKQSEPITGRADIIRISDQWKPYRTVACMILWHYYLSKPWK
jgi:DNA-3-methyladenine glycosylase II